MAKTPFMRYIDGGPHRPADAPVRFCLTVDSSAPNLNRRLWAAEAAGLQMRVVWSDYDRAFLAACCFIDPGPKEVAIHG